MANFNFLENFDELKKLKPKWSRYCLKKVVGKGTYAYVCKAYDDIEKRDIAIKCIPMKNFNPDGRNKVFNYMFRELRILRHVQSNYLLELYDAEKSIQDGNIILWLAVPFMDHDLHSILYKEKCFFNFDAITKIAFQLLKGLLYLFKSNVVHRDLKPNNIGINENLRIRILDFGMSRGQEPEMSKSVTSRYYRAIETYFTKSYSTQVDMWAIGCILAEILTKKVLFKGTTKGPQVDHIASIVGLSEEDCKLYPSLRNYVKTFPCDDLRNYIESDILSFGCSNEDDKNSSSDNALNVINLICDMLKLDPAKRIKPMDAIESPLFRTNSDLIREFQNEEKAEWLDESCSIYPDELVQSKIDEIIDSYANEPMMLS